MKRLLPIAVLALAVAAFAAACGGGGEATPERGSWVVLGALLIARFGYEPGQANAVPPGRAHQPEGARQGCGRRRQDHGQERGAHGQGRHRAPPEDGWVAAKITASRFW